MNRIVKIIGFVIVAACICIAGMVAGPIYLNAANAPTIYKDRCVVGTCGDKTLLVHPQSADRFYKPNWWFPTKVSSCSDEQAFGPRALDGTIACYVQRQGPVATDLKVSLSSQERTIGIVLLVVSWPIIVLFLLFILVAYIRERLVSGRGDVVLSSPPSYEQAIENQYGDNGTMRQSLLQHGETQYGGGVGYGGNRHAQQEWMLMSDGWLKICLTVIIAVAVVFSIPSLIMGAVVTSKSMAVSSENECRVVWCANQDVAVIESQRLNRGFSEAVQLKRCDKYVNDPLSAEVSCFLIESAVVKNESHLTLQRPNFVIGVSYLAAGTVLVTVFMCVAAALVTRAVMRRLYPQQTQL